MKLKTQGFTFIEVLIAMAIFVFAVIAVIDLVRGSVRATKDAKTVSVATWLLQKVIVDLETQLETQGIDKGCEKKKEGKFEAPYEQYTWISYCTEIDFKISEAASKLMAREEGEKDEKDEDNKENMFQKLVLNTASEYLTKAMRELHVEVLWKDGKHQRKVDVTTHFARFDLPVTLPVSSGGTS